MQATTKPKTTTRSLLIATAAGTVTGGLVGMFASPIAYWMLGKKFSGPNRWLVWAAIGIVGAPVSFIFSGAIANPPQPRPIARSTPATPVKPAAIAPTPKPKPIALNVPRERLQPKFEEAGFTFEELTTKQGKPLLVGRSPDGLTMLELIGAPENLSELAFLTGMIKDDRQTNAQNVTYLLFTLKAIAPGWESADWVSSAMDQFVAGDRDEAEIVKGNLRYKLSVAREVGVLTLSVEPKK